MKVLTPMEPVGDIESPLREVIRQLKSGLQIHRDAIIVVIYKLLMCIIVDRMDVFEHN